MGRGAFTDGMLELSGPLTFDTAGAHYQDSANLFASASVTAVNLEQVDRVDSAGLALLLEWQSAARRAGRELVFSNAPNDLLRLAALAEASDLLGLMPVPEFAHGDLV